ncbi:glycosyltransferase [Peribacillus asahii]|uniref:glycosyltransferase n=1 Tax=Peribacillus asahii TaxID=228899 RepID=UPI0037FDEB58
MNIGNLQLIGIFSVENFYTKLPNRDEYYPAIIPYSIKDTRSGNLKPDGIETQKVQFLKWSVLLKDSSARDQQIFQSFKVKKSIFNCRERKGRKKIVQTIAFYIEEPIKINQGFMYNQIIKLNQYRAIVIGPFSNSNNVQYQFEHYYNVNEIKDLGAFFRKQNVVAIHAHQGKHSLNILPAAIKHGIPLIVHFRGRDSSTQTKKRFLENKKRYKSLINQGAGYFAVCRFLAKELKTLGFPEDRIHVLYGGLDLNLYPYFKRSLPKEGEIRILSVARLVEKKGFLTLLKAFHLIHHKYPRATLHIIGTGEDEEKIKGFIDKYQLNNRVFLRGAMDSHQISKELRDSHLFCLASETAEDGDVEGIPNALKEAMASGLPVISTFNGGIPELIEHKRTGYLAPEKDYVKLSKGIEYFLNHPEVWRKYTQRARQVIEQKFDLNKQIVEQQKLYELIKNKKGKKRG